MSFRIPHPAFRILAAAILVLCVAGEAAADQVRQRDAKGSKARTRNGKVKEVSKTEVQLQLTPGDQIAKIPANEIETISYDGQPADLGALPTAARGGNYANANELIRKLTDAGLTDPNMKDELEFYKMYVQAKTAMTSGKLVDMKTARETIDKYMKTSVNSWHYYEAVELLGEICLEIAAVEVESLRNSWYKMAIEEAYTRLAQAPWDETKIRAKISRAKAQHLSKEIDAAVASYDEALKDATGKESDPQIASLMLAARVGKAEVVGEKSPNEGIRLVQEIIAKADPEDSRVQAVAALAIARCYEKDNKPKDALLNYLKVDVLYFSQQQYHAEALYNLSRLWNTLNNPERAREAATTLRTRYPGSVWAAKLGAGG